MKPAHLSIRVLRAFLVLCDLGNFTRAAQASHLSQPAFSALIRSLEDDVGARLFDRSTRSVQLTPEGRLFRNSARQLVDDADRALTDLADHVERRKGRVHVAAVPSLAASWLPRIFAEYRAAWPGVTLAISDLISDDCIQLVRGGQADFALAAAGVRASDASELKTTFLGQGRFHLACREDHPLARETRMTLRKMAPWPFIHMARNSSVRFALDAAMHPMQMNTVLEVETLATAIGMVAADLGICVVPALSLNQCAIQGVVTRPLPLSQLGRRMLLVRRREGSLSTAAQALHDLVLQRIRFT